ncbi:hypothetical protein DPMN_105173 [Dreissena polymorpha]|uniref:Uncharacterized protein n=1 Tax=Dreissena polymorpha TaxID=45954 RepID=A0A9D4H924_DREPO|nr:hypothetical protein DPMN_105173 [Dreissena polymorpha]
MIIGQKLCLYSHVIQLTGTIFELKSHIKEANVLTKFHENWAKKVTSRVFTCFHYIRIEKNAPPTGGHTNFHDDWAKIVTSRVFTRKTAPPNPGSHVIQLTGTIFKLHSHIKETNVLTKFHENWAKNVTSRVFTCFHNIHMEKNAPPTGRHVFSLIWTIFEPVQDINKTNFLTNFHDDWAKIVTSRVFTRTNFEFNSHIKETKFNVLTKFHENWAKNVTSRVFSCFHYIHIEKNAPPTADIHVFQLTRTIFELNSQIKATNVLTKFQENWAKNVTSRVFTCFHNIHMEKNAPPTGGHVFSLIWTIFELVQDINKTNFLTNFHDDWAKIVTSRVFTSYVIQLTRTNFEFNSHIKETKFNVLTKFHENWAKNVTSRVFSCFHYIHIEKNAPPTADIHVFQLTRTIFELNSQIKATNVLTKFQENWAKNVTSRKNALPTDGHVFSPIWTILKSSEITIKPMCLYSHVIQLTGTIFELKSHIKETNVLTKFHENWAKKVTSRRKMHRPLAAMFFSPIWTIFELVRDINKTNVLTNFHDDWAKIVTSRVFTRFLYKPNKENCSPPWQPWHQTNVLTKFHENWVKNVTSRVEKCPAHWRPYIRNTNVLTNFHDDWAKILTSRVFTRKTAPPTGGHVFQLTGTTFELDQHIIKENILTNTTQFELGRDFNGAKLLTKFHEDGTRNVAS